METKAKLTKKLLSTFLAVLMVFSACYVGIDGAYTAYAAAEDSDYTADEVIALVNAATAGGFSLSSSGNAWNYAADDGKVIAAAEAIFDYALNAYREGKEPTSKGNSTKALYDSFTAEFQSRYTNKTAAERLVKNVLDPDGTTVYAYGSGAAKSTKLSESQTSYGNNVDVTGTFPITSYPGYYAAGNVTKTVDISLDLNKYLMTFGKIEDIPSTVITGVKYTYAHGTSGTATVDSVTTRTAEEGSGCNKETVTYYTPTIKTSTYNYMPAKPNRQVVKDKTIRKTLLTVEKYFNEELLATTVEDMLAMNVTDIKTLYDTTDLMYKSVDGLNDAVLSHFGLAPAKIHQFMTDVDFAYRVVAAKYNIDNLNALIGSEYNTESYAEMSALYAKTSTAYDVVFALDQEIIDYITSDEGGYAGQYASAIALKAQAESYNAILFDIMTEQKLEETVAAMVATYTDYINVLNKEDIETPTDAEVIGLVQKVEAFDAIIDSYRTYNYFRTYWTTAYETEWANFSAKLDEVYDVRGLKMEFETYYDYFLPLIYTTQIDTLDNEAAIALHRDLDTKLAELRASYNTVVSKWGGTIADKIFTTVYEGSPYLLQTLVDSVKNTGKDAVKNVLIARTEAQLDAVYAYKDTTVVNFDNFASIKSTLTYFDYDLYNYVNGGEEGQNKWLSADYTNKYAMVQTLLDRYHAFSTTDGKSFFNESFTYADANGNYAIRYAGSQKGANGVEMGYPNDIVRDGAKDNYVVTEEVMNDTVDRLDDFIISRDFGALIGLVDAEDEDVYVDLATYVEQMLNEMLYNDALINTLVGAIYPMIVDLLNTELVGMLADMGTNDNPAASACIDIGEMTGGDGSGHLYVYMDDDLFNGQHKQRNLDEVLADAGLYVYPQTLADSLLMSNPVAFGVGTPIYTALKDAGRDWTKLVCADDPETPEDETKVLEFEWGVYDAETFTDTLAVVFDSLLPLLNAVLTGTSFNETLANAAYAYSTDTKYIVNVGKLAVFGDLNLQIPGLTVFNDVLVPLFEILGVEKIPTLKSGASGDDIAKAIVEPLLGVIERVLANPISEVLSILPNLVYFVSMDSVQEILDSLNIALHLKIEAEVDKDNSGTLVDLLGGTLLSLLGDKLAFDVELKIADLIDLYDMLGFEISDFNEILKLVTEGMGLELPPIKQQEIIFCSDWGTSPTGRVYLEANKGDLMFWLLSYVLSALVPDENGNSLLTGLLGDSEMDPMIAGILNVVVGQLATDPEGALAALIEILNPQTYDMAEMDWAEGKFNYNGIEGTTYTDIIYLSYANDWTQDKANYVVENIDDILYTVLDMLEVDLGADDLGAYLQDMLAGVFTNANITALVTMLGGLGDSPSAIIEDIVATQMGIDIGSWFTAFGYLFPAETWAEDAEIIPAGHRNYVNEFGVEGIANEDGTITWVLGGRQTLVDGDAHTFVDILIRLLAPASGIIEFLFAGGEISAFEHVVKLQGYETYDTTLGMLLNVLGVENLPTQEEYNANAMDGLARTLTATLDWFYALTGSDDMVAQVLEILPNLFYYIESNGLSVLLKNLLMPVLVLVDTVRPILDVDINGVLSLIVSDFLNYGELNTDSILNYVFGTIPTNEDEEYKYYSIDINNLRLSDVIDLADTYLGTNLKASHLMDTALAGVCSGLVEDEFGYKTTVTAADTITLLVTGLLEALAQPAKDETMTNGDVIFALIAELTGNEDIAGLYPAIAGLIKGVDVEYTEPNWGYFYDENGMVPSISYLAYTTDWTEETADEVYAELDGVLEMFLPDLLADMGAEDLAGIVEGLLTDNVYTDAILNTIVEAVANLLVAVNTSLFTHIDVILDTNIASWFAMCEEVDGKLVCTKKWGVDAAATAAEKKAAFVAGLKELLASVDNILSFVFFGDNLELFTGSEKNEDGTYKYNSIITITGIEGYNRALVPVLEALGVVLPTAEALEYKTSNAVEAIIDGVLALVDKISANPVEEVFNLLPNLIYFINADGVKSSVNNLLIPVNELLAKVSPIIGQELSIEALIGDSLPIDITNITTDALLAIAAENDVVLKAEMVDIIKNLYVGELKMTESVNGLNRYYFDITGAEGDVLTIILSIAIELFNSNEDLFGELLGAETYTAIVTLLKGIEVKYADYNWAYMYEDIEGATAAEQLAANGFPATELGYLEYSTLWTEETAKAAYDILDEVLDMFLPELLGEENDSLKTLVVNLLDESVYTDANLNAIVELIVNAIYGLEGDIASVIEGVDTVLDADIQVWKNFCTADAEGNYVCTKAWGVDDATDKKAAFVAGLKEVLAPANKLLSWIFFGDSYEFFNGSTGEVLITINGGEGYAYGLVPIFEALGCNMAPAATFYNAETDTYDVGAAVESILDAAIALLDKVENSEKSINFVADLLPNLLYFINADGLKSAVANLLAPVNGVLACLKDLVGADNLGDLLGGAIGFDINNIDTDTLIGILESELDFVMNETMKQAIKDIYAVGTAAPFTSANGKTAYRVDTTDSGYDVITVLLSFAAEAFTINEDLFADLVGAELYKAIIDLAKGAQGEFVYQTPDWGYMYEGGVAELDDNNGYLPEYAEGSAAFIYTQYANNWNEATAENVNELVDEIIAGFMKNNSLGQLLDNAIVNGIYSESLANSLVELVVELLIDYAGFVEAAGALLGSEELAKWFSDEYVEIDADGNVTCVKNWGFDEATTNEEKRDAFVESFVLVLEPVYRVLEWLLFAEDITLFNSSTGEAIITVTGAEGYANGFALLLEAVGATMEGAEGNYVDGKSAILPVEAFELYDADGNVIGHDMEKATRAIFGAVVDWLYALCGDLDNPEVGVIGAMLDRLPNFIYNLNAGTLEALVNNLLLPVNEVLTKLAPVVGEVDILELIDDALGFAEDEDLQLNWYGVFDIVESLVNLYWPAEVQDFLATLYLGQAVKYESANGGYAYYAAFNESAPEGKLVSGREDMLTIVLSFVLDGALDERNEAQLVDWIGQDIYDVIYAYISGAVHTLDMQEFTWLFVDQADTGAVISPITFEDSNFGELYNDLYTEEMGAYIEENLPLFVDTMILLLGIDTGVTDANGDPVIYRGLEDLLEGTLGSTIYTRANLVSILEAIQGILPTLQDALGSAYEALATVIDSVLDVDLHYWDTYEIAAFADGDRDTFVAELVRMVRPAAPVLKWLLTGEDLIALFHTTDAAIGATGRESTIVVEGAEGYAYGIIPLLEAFDYQGNILTPAEYEAAAEADVDALLLNVINPLLDVVDRLLADPVNELTNILPGLLYFINSNGVDTVIKNTANAVFTVLEAIEPITGEINVYDLIGMDLSTLNIETLVAELIADLEADTELKLVDPALSAVKELSVGTVISYESKNGETYYTMTYATGADEVDMTSVLLRAVLYFVSIPENAEALKVLLADELDPDSYEFVASLLDNFAQMAASEDGIYEIMYTVYNIFKAANEAAAGVKDWYDTFNGDYSFLNKMFEDSDLQFINQLRESLKNLLDNSDYSDIIDGDELAPNGFIRFFQKIAEFFQKIADFFANLFK